MKKNYMKPEGVVVAMNLNENIATSNLSGDSSPWLIYADPRPGDPDGPEYINSSDVQYVQITNNKSFNDFYNWMMAKRLGIDPLCGKGV